jgi:PAS domain S-box-containing protein
MRILIVDDAAENIYLLKAILAGAGHEVVDARNGKEALDRLGEGTFDLIVSDGLMPVMDGFRFCRECKTSPAWRNIPFVFYTAAYAEREDERFALSLGADAHIVKPQEPEIFLQIIADLLERHGLRPASPSRKGGVDDFTYLTEHNKRLVEKLEHQMAELEEANRSLQASEKQYRFLAENVQDVIFVLDMDLNYSYISPSVRLLRGYEPAEVMGQPASAALTPASRKAAAAIFSEEITRERNGPADIHRSRTVELEMLRKDGTTVWTEVKVSLLRDEQNRPTGILGVTRDITKRKEVQEALDRSLVSLRKTLNGTVHAIIHVVEARDPYTAGHQRRVAHLSRAIAGEMGLDGDRIEGLQMAAMIHDIGKISVPVEILSKPTRLTPIEFDLIKVHAQAGHAILQGVEFPWPIAQIVLQHHERLDGSGYPNGLKGNDILLEARIVAVADTVEAMASNRPYRPGLGLDLALEEISKNMGLLYDAEAGNACLQLMREKGFAFE